MSCQTKWISNPVGSGVFAWIRIRISNFSGSGSGYGFQISLDPDPAPDPVFTFLWFRIRIRIQPGSGAKKSAERALRYLIEENLKIMSKNRQKMQKITISY